MISRSEPNRLRRPELLLSGLLLAVACGASLVTPTAHADDPFADDPASYWTRPSAERVQRTPRPRTYDDSVETAVPLPRRSSVRTISNLREQGASPTTPTSPIRMRTPAPEPAVQLVPFPAPEPTPAPEPAAEFPADANLLTDPGLTEKTAPPWTIIPQPPVDSGTQSVPVAPPTAEQQQSPLTEQQARELHSKRLQVIRARQYAAQRTARIQARKRLGYDPARPPASTDLRMNPTFCRTPWTYISDRPLGPSARW